MFRFSYYRSDGSEEWDLRGHLSGRPVAELGFVWRRIRERAPHRPAVVDIQELTSIDETGERLLAEMRAPAQSSLSRNWKTNTCFQSDCRGRLEPAGDVADKRVLRMP